MGAASKAPSWYPLRTTASCCSPKEDTTVRPNQLNKPQRVGFNFTVLTSMRTNLLQIQENSTSFSLSPAHAACSWYGHAGGQDYVNESIRIGTISTAFHSHQRSERGVFKCRRRSKLGNWRAQHPLRPNGRMRDSTAAAVVPVSTAGALASSYKQWTDRSIELQPISCGVAGGRTIAPTYFDRLTPQRFLDPAQTQSFA